MATKRLAHHFFSSVLPLEVASSVSPGRPPVDDSVTLRAFTFEVPFLAREPSTVISSPIFNVSGASRFPADRAADPTPLPSS